MNNPRFNTRVMSCPSNMWDNKFVVSEQGCHLFTGRTKNGYGIIAGKRAHRVMYEEVYGPIPRGLMVLHKCNVPNCVNPLHLYAGTAYDNAVDRVRAGRNKGMLGMKHSAEARAKMSAAHRQRNKSRMIEWHKERVAK